MEDEELSVTQRYGLIYGGNTPLGARCVADLKGKGWWIASADYSVNPHADVNILLQSHEPPEVHERSVISCIQRVLDGKLLDLIFCTNETLKEGSIEDNLISVGMDMWLAHVAPSLICAKIAAVCMKNSGVLVLSGSTAAMKANADKIGYSIAKSSVVHLTKCLAMPGSGMPAGSLVICLMPFYLDTPYIRGLNQHVSCGSFTPLQFISDLIISWGMKKNLPGNGAMCQLITTNSNTEVIYKK
ncbi:dihydropteridine reductase-like [Atheta coriaria]|uniref:dihydropteridine reductase-like n=1 Tax=Dalotia coriaria TaxID=877792 RepID=UPI0031F420AC